MPISGILHDISYQIDYNELTKANLTILVTDGAIDNTMLGRNIIVSEVNQSIPLYDQYVLNILPKHFEKILQKDEAPLKEKPLRNNFDYLKIQGDI